jgi:hypothetical protein
MDIARHNHRSIKVIVACIALLCAAVVMTSCKKDEEIPEETAEPGCQKDDARDAKSALDLAMAKAVTGYVCPKQDMDWYAFKLDSGNRLLSVSAQMSADISPVELTYTIYPQNDTEKAVAIPAGDDTEQVHCLDPGAYYLVLRDQGNDNEDIRHTYSLTLSGRPEPDHAEPNNTIETSTTLHNGATTQGYIACVGDQDWYEIDVSQGNVLGIHLTSEVTAYQPKLKLLSAEGNLLAEPVNLAGTKEPTALDVFHVLLASGKYYIVISDDDNKEADSNIPYTLTVEAIQDKDTNEPNNSSSEATALTEAVQTCTTAWSSTFEIQGTVGARGDIDWYKLPVTGCGGGVIEAELVFQTQSLSDSDAWKLQKSVQASIALIRAHTATPCSKDKEAVCQSLNIACDPKKEGWECEGFFNSCGSDGFCTGGSACLPSGVCGATETERHYRVAAIPSTVSGPPLENKASLSAPLFGDDVVYLRVGDYQSDGGDATALYTLRVRIRSDPDPNDRSATPNNLYANLLNNDNFPVKESLARAATLPVHDCTTGDCCSAASAWITGAISYQNDVDWFKYSHPCPCKDCLLKLYYQVGTGPVDHGVYLYRGQSRWFTFNIAGTGAHGDGECLYAYQGHCSNCNAGVASGTTECSTYYIAIRDYLGEGELSQDVIGTASRWSSDQTYRICLEKYFEGCQTPCKVANDGTCTSP